MQEVPFFTVSLISELLIHSHFSILPNINIFKRIFIQFLFFFQEKVIRFEVVSRFQKLQSFFGAVFFAEGFEFAEDVDGEAVEGEELFEVEVDLAEVSLLLFVGVAEGFVKHIAHFLCNLEILVRQDMRQRQNKLPIVADDLRKVAF